MENQPNTENVAFLDEYPHLEQKVRLRRLARYYAGKLAVEKSVIYLPNLEEPDDIA